MVCHTQIEPMYRMRLKSAVRYKMTRTTMIAITWKLEQFLMSVENNPRLHCFCFTSHCDWSRKLALWLVQKTRTALLTMRNYESRIGRPRFPALWEFSCFYSKFSLAFQIDCCDFLILVLRQSIEKSFTVNIKLQPTGSSREIFL